jgi:CelD/BcsL family acetyltransferase involved in cellulose biosynthesis
MNIAAYDSPSIFSELKSEWNDLLHRSVTNRIFNTWEWQSTWWQVYQPGELWVITIRDDIGNLVGLAPWFIEVNTNKERIVRTIGCVDVTDYLDLLVDSSCSEETSLALAAFVAAQSHVYDSLNLCNLPQDSAGYRIFASKLHEEGLRVTLTQQEVCPIIELPNDVEAYFELLDKKQRHELRRKLRRIEGASEAVAWYIVDHSHDLDVEIETFITLMAASQADKATFLSESKNVLFFKTIIPLVFTNNWLQLSFLTIDGTPVATYLNFVYDNQVLVYNSGLLPGQYSQLSPGIVLLTNIIQWAIEHHFAVFDFLRGDEEYKYRMGAKDTAIYMLYAENK